MTTLKTIDAHVGGQPLRLVVDGYPAPRGQTLLDKREWARKHADRIRRALILEPRGHADMCGAVLTEPALPGAHAGVLFMDAHGYPAMSGHSVIAVAAVALARGLLVPGGDGTTVVFDTPAGTVRTTCARHGFREASEASASGDGVPREVNRHRDITLTNVPSFVLHGGLPIKLGGRAFRADVAFAGGFYAIVDSEAAGLGVSASQVSELRRVGMEIARAVEAVQSVVHPLEPRLTGIEGTIFTAPASERGADLRSVMVSAAGAVDRSPGGTATAAIMSVLAAMGLLEDHAPFVHESIIGSQFRGRIEGHTRVGEYDAVVPAIEGSAWITGEHTFVLDEDDPFREGFVL